MGKSSSSSDMAAQPTLDDVLDDAALSASFEKHLRTQFAVENL
jgi:hypothetical protein